MEAMRLKLKVVPKTAILRPASVLDMWHRAPVSGTHYLNFKATTILLKGNSQKAEDSNKAYPCLKAPLPVDTGADEGV
jgi:hypothetical protein